jgi:hypothetical protein
MDILDEIKEDLRSEQAKKFWHNHGRHILAAVAILVLGTGLWSGLQQYNQHRAAIDSEKFSAAVQLADDQKRDQALAELAKISNEAGAGYKTLALFSEANLQIKAGDNKAAAATFDRLADNRAIDPMYRELATIYSANLQLDFPQPEFDKIFDRLQPLTATGGAWRYSALELQGLVRAQQGKKDEAAAIFARLQADAQTPSGIKARAERWASQLLF